MKQKKFCTYPLGHIVVVYLSITILIIILLSIIMFCSGYFDSGKFGIGVALIVLLVSLLHIREGNLNFINITVKQVKHKNQVYSWEEVYITMCSFRLRRAPIALIYFSDHYLSTEEISKVSKYNGFYMMLTKRRAEYIFKFYNKKVMILNNSLVPQKVLGIVNSHNNSLQDKVK